MPHLTLVAALAANRVIGRDGSMPWHLPEDLAHFKSVTMGHPMLMGRKTFDSIGRPLPGRRTIVITQDTAWSHPGVEVAHSFTDALSRFDESQEVFVVGGATIYEQALPLAHRMVLTHIEANPEGDTFFPAWDSHEWSEVARDAHDDFAFVTYERAAAR